LAGIRVHCNHALPSGGKDRLTRWARAFHAYSGLVKAQNLIEKKDLQGRLSRMQNYLRLNPHGHDVNFIQRKMEEVTALNDGTATASH
jgi:hypothetical protein